MSHYFENDSKLISKEKLIIVKILNKSFSFYTDRGVFSKDGLDYGTRALLESLDLKKVSGNILDLGCGYGAVGIILNKLCNLEMDMVDINQRAIGLTKKNIILNKCEKTKAFLSDGYNNISNKYNYIITNPPIRIGKDNLYKLLLGASKHLTKNGELWFVIHKDQGAKTTYKDMKKHYNIEIVDKNKSFWIFRAIMH